VARRYAGRPPPATYEEFRALLDAGVLITNGGKRVIRRRCPVCGAGLLGSEDGAETCWCAVPCPQCRATVGRRCRRPSEDGVFGNRPHDSRARLAQADTERRAQAGDPRSPGPVAACGRGPAHPVVSSVQSPQGQLLAQQLLESREVIGH
jgi:hypothetical protein